MEARGLPTYPVWVGDLQDNVNENDLLRIFTPHGTIANCKIMRDENGVSKYVRLKLWLVFVYSRPEHGFHKVTSLLLPCTILYCQCYCWICVCHLRSIIIVKLLDL